MEDKKFNADIRSALSRMQPDLPEGMTERFMARLSQEKPAAGNAVITSARRTVRLSLWSSAAVAAAAVALFYLLPSTTPTPKSPAVRDAQATASATVPAAPAATEPAANTPERHVGTSPRAARKAVAAPAESHVQTAKADVLPAEPLQAEAATGAEVQQTAPQPATEPAQYAKAGKAPATTIFTAQELVLMERAEQMSAQAAIYAAEARQEALVASRETSAARAMHNNRKEEQTIIRKV